MRGLRPAGYGAALLLALLVALAALLVRPDSGATGPGDIAMPAVPPLDRPLRLAVMGTSLSARYAWSQALADRLSSCLPHPVALGVFAEPGQGSAWGETVVAEVARFAPDIVLIEFLANDSDLRQLRTVSGSRAAHRRLIAALRAGGQDPAIALMTMNPAFGLRGLVRPRLDDFHAMYAALAREAATGLIDATSRWRAVLADADRASLLPDGLHPTESAQTTVMLQAIVPVLARALQESWPACAGLKP